MREAHGRDQNRMAEDLQLLRNRPIVEQRVDLIWALIYRQSVGRIIGPPDVRCRADVAAHGEGLFERIAGVAAEARGPKGKLQLPASGERPFGLEAPSTPNFTQIGLRWSRSTDEESERWLPVHPVLEPAEPAVPPADHLRDEVDPRPWDRVVRPHVTPRPHE